MKPIRKKVHVSRDHFEQQTRATPLAAIQELIWNGLDSGGPSVEVRFNENGLGNIESIEIEDRGQGVHSSYLDRTFGQVGDSIKVIQRQTPEGRVLHGKEGKGRFKALALGSKATWTTTYRNDSGKLFQYAIKMEKDAPDHIELTKELEVRTKTTGTLLRIENIENHINVLQSKDTRDKIAEHFALYLKDYPATRLLYDRKLVDLSDLIESTKDFEVPVDNGEMAKLTVIEWKFKPEARRFLICDSKGFAMKEELASIKAPGFFFTAYLKTDRVKEWFKDGLLSVTELNPKIAAVLDSARDALREYFRDRQADQAQEVVQQWREDEIYPYTSEESKSPIKEIERKVFDIVALKVHQYHDSFRDGNLESKKLTLRLFKEALESNPGSVQKIITEVLKLPKDLQDDLAGILQRTSFQAIIEASKTVSRRLDTIRAIDEILFSEDWKKRLLERTQLHRILVHELWIFGEEYTLDVDDDPLPLVLGKHISLLGRELMSPEHDCKLINGKSGILDLMLSRRFQRHPKRFEHLILELKRPSVKLGADEIKQIKEYGFTVSKDERFSKENTDWTFILLGNEFDGFAEEEANSDNRPYGCIHKKGSLSIWIKRWSEVLHDARLRYEFFRERLNLEASSESGMSYLNDRYSDLLTGRGKRKGKENVANSV